MCDSTGNYKYMGGYCTNMARNTAPEDEPTSEWEHSHALQEGDELIDSNEGTPITVVAVTADGNVKARCWIDQRHGQEYTDEVWTEEGATNALAHGVVETTDGKSHELASF